METVPSLVTLLTTETNEEFKAQIRRVLTLIFTREEAALKSSSKEEPIDYKTSPAKVEHKSKSSSGTSKFIAQVKDGKITNVYIHTAKACQETGLSRTAISNSLKNGVVVQKTGDIFVKYDDLDTTMQQSYDKPLPVKPKKSTKTQDVSDNESVVSEAPTEHHVDSEAEEVDVPAPTLPTINETSPPSSEDVKSDAVADAAAPPTSHEDIDVAVVIDA